jgi:hypothetical protein
MLCCVVSFLVQENFTDYGSIRVTRRDTCNEASKRYEIRTIRYSIEGKSNAASEPTLLDTINAA